MRLNRLHALCIGIVLGVVIDGYEAPRQSSKPIKAKEITGDDLHQAMVDRERRVRMLLGPASPGQYPVERITENGEYIARWAERSGDE